ncbi:hypothetical protein ACF064_07205 [Streptomyces sp. NPDC015492]|uniref:hypothetical protein n=1 Tax=Streptomyces sp. NPDC015492 TaxID=3364958 RepID=UPI0036FD41E6
MVRHEERVTQVLLTLDAPTPASVRKALDAIGSTDTHLRDVAQSEAATLFVLGLAAATANVLAEDPRTGAETW